MVKTPGIQLYTILTNLKKVYSTTILRGSYTSFSLCKCSWILIQRAIQWNPNLPLPISLQESPQFFGNEFPFLLRYIHNNIVCWYEIIWYISLFDTLAQFFDGLFQQINLHLISKIFFFVEEFQHEHFKMVTTKFVNVIGIPRLHDFLDFLKKSKYILSASFFLFIGMKNKVFFSMRKGNSP